MARIDAPDVIGVRRSQSNDRAVLVIEAALLLVTLRLLEAFLAPEPLHLLVVDAPALDPQQLCHLSIAITPIALRQSDHGKPQLIVVLFDSPVLHGTAGKSDHLAGPAFGRGEFLTRVNDGLTKLARRQALGFRWFRLSLRMSLSSSNSATVLRAYAAALRPRSLELFSRAFSFSRLRISDS
nr:hypothetical protein [Aliiruegeria sabulilitoris]